MMVEHGEYKQNAAGDGEMPCCAKCQEPYGDGDIGDAKNYPEDGVIAVFFTCEKCKEESQFTYVPWRDAASYRRVRAVSEA